MEQINDKLNLLLIEDKKNEDQDTTLDLDSNEDLWFDKLVEKHDFQSGDILLFQHHYEVKKWSDLLFDTMDAVIGFLTWSKYTHSAVIIKDPSWRPDLKGYYMLESNWEMFKDSEDDEIKIGVELVPLKKILDINRQNKLYYRKIRCNRDADFYDKLNKAQSVVHNRPYDLIITDWIKALFKWQIGSVRRKKTFWCSALVSFMETQLGLLPEDTDWTIMSPKDLGTENKKTNLKFQNCEIDDEVLLEY